MKRLAIVFGLATLATACQTANTGLRAKTAGPGAGACLRAGDSRADCEDKVGCFWDYDLGSCASSH